MSTIAMRSSSIVLRNADTGSIFAIEGQISLHSMQRNWLGRGVKYEVVGIYHCDKHLNRGRAEKNIRAGHELAEQTMETMP